jgi:NO-binding membrane sensor protein with MHYT domain
LQQQQIATIEWVQGTVMGFAVGLEVLTWILVAHLIGGIEYGWPIHLVCILAWSSNADLDFDEFFRRRLWVRGAVAQ